MFFNSSPYPKPRINQIPPRATDFEASGSRPLPGFTDKTSPVERLWLGLNFVVTQVKDAKEGRMRKRDRSNIRVYKCPFSFFAIWIAT